MCGFASVNCLASVDARAFAAIKMQWISASFPARHIFRFYGRYGKGTYQSVILLCDMVAISMLPMSQN
jgi:hypothetical protein